MNRWAVTISGLSGLNPSSCIHRGLVFSQLLHYYYTTHVAAVSLPCPHLPTPLTGLHPSLIHFLTPLLPLIRPLAVTLGLLDMCLSFILPLGACCNDKYPYHIARHRMFQHTGRKGFRVSGHVYRHECLSPSSWIRRWDHKQDVVLGAYRCRLMITDFLCCNCTLITPRSVCVNMCNYISVCPFICLHVRLHRSAEE